MLLATAVAIAGVDGLTKHLANEYLIEGRLYGIGGGWGLRRIHNERGALAGFAVGWTALVWLVATILAAMVVQASPSNTAAAVGLGAAIGGATGNLGDRVIRGSVVDFVAAGRWPVFNVADAAMTVGLLVAAGSLL